MKENRFKKLLSQGRVPIGHMIFEFATRGIAQILERSGVDFVVVDTEHAAFSSADVANLMAWFKATSITPFVRVPAVQHHFISGALDNGALGVMVPNVKNAEEARAVVAAVKYAPEGKRGCIFGDTHTDFQAVKPDEFIRYSNNNTSILCQIESTEGLENVGEIAATPGVDVLWIGQYDLSQSLGIPGQFGHRTFLNAIKKVVSVARTQNLGVAMQPETLAQAKEWLELGVNILSYSGDFYVYQHALTQGITDLRQLTKK